MRRYGVWAVGLLAMAVVNTGCVSLEEHQALQRAKRTVDEKLAEALDDLQNAELMNRQKDTQIAALKDQIATKDAMINSLTAQVEGLENSLASAQTMLEKMAGKGAGVINIMPSTALPPDIDRALKDLAARFPNQIVYLPEKGAVRWKADLLFPLGSDKLADPGSESMQALDEFAKIAMSEAAANFDVIVVGHTCNTPIRRAETLAEHKTNWHLSCHRAISLVQLLGETGLQMDRMGAMGYGEYRPIAENTTTENKARNRRVEIFMVPRDKVQSVSTGGEGGATLYRSNDQDLDFVRPATPSGTAAPAPAEADEPAPAPRRRPRAADENG